MDPTRFRPLDAYLLPPPLPLLVGLALVVGLLGLGRGLADRLRPGAATALDHAAGFVVANGAVGALLHTAALLGRLELPFVRAVALGISALGVWEAARRRRALRPWLRRLRQAQSGRPLLEQLAVWPAAVTLIALAAAALGPAADGDSLDYHLGAPLDWLNHGAAVLRSDWLHARLIGLGEMINLLGLAAGVDNLGALTQWVGLALAALVLGRAMPRDPRNRALWVALVVACPLTVYLIPNQKPQFLPAAATTFALVLLAQRRRQLDAGTFVLALGCAAYAMACKYPGLLSGGAALAVGLALAQRAGRLRVAAAVASTAVALLAGGVWLRNVWFYGDPISPFLEAWRSQPDDLTAAFAAYLRAYGSGARSGVAIFWRPLDLIVTTSPGRLGTVLGVGALAALTVSRRPVTARLLLIVAGGAALAQLALSQFTARFFLEPYLWAAAAAVMTPWSRRKTALLAALAVQGALVAAAALFAAGTLLPGALTPRQRDAVLRRAAPGYALSRWIDAHAPAEAVIYVEERTHALWPRPFLSSDLFRYWRYVPLERAELERRYAARFADDLDRFGVTHLVLAAEPAASSAAFLPPGCLGAPIAGPQVFDTAARNPFNRVAQSVTYRIVPLDRPRCGLEVVP